MKKQVPSYKKQTYKFVECNLFLKRGLDKNIIVAVLFGPQQLYF